MTNTMNNLQKHSRVFMRPTICAVVMSSLLACASNPPEVPIALDLPPAFTGPVATGVGVWPESGWWMGFGNGELTSLISVARDNNIDLTIAAARILQAEAQTRIAAASLFPSVDLGLNAERERGRLGGRWTSDNSFGLALEAGYELDLWGAARNNLRVFEAQLRSSRYAQEVVALTITANVATTYFSALGLADRITIARRNLENSQRVLMATERRVAGGISSRVEVAQQRALVAGQEAQIIALEQEEREAHFALAVLLGRPPENFSIRSASLTEIITPDVAPGLPSELLERRPDIAQAEAALGAAQANVLVARAAFLPRIGLTAAGGIARGEAFTTLGSTGLLYSVGASVLQSIFDGGQRRGQRQLAEAQQLELVAAYRGTVLQALSDTETALNLVASLRNQAAAKRRQVESGAQAFGDAERLYTEGLIDLLSLLQSQQTLFQAQDELVQIELARIQASVALYKALGGGWLQETVED